MKKDIHPEWYPDAKVICNGEVVMLIGSTQPELRVDIWSGNHPFYTGEQRIIDTAGQVERFMKRLQQYDKHQEDTVEREQEAQQKLEQRFLKQQIAALDLDDEVTQVLHDAAIVSVGDLRKKLKKDQDSLLALPGFTPDTISQIEKKLNEARERYFAEA